MKTDFVVEVVTPSGKVRRSSLACSTFDQAKAQAARAIDDPDWTVRIIRRHTVEIVVQERRNPPRQPSNRLRDAGETTRETPR